MAWHDDVSRIADALERIEGWLNPLERERRIEHVRQDKLYAVREQRRLKVMVVQYEWLLLQGHGSPPSIISEPLLCLWWRHLGKVNFSLDRPMTLEQCETITREVAKDIRLPPTLCRPGSKREAAYQAWIAKNECPPTS